MNEYNTLRLEREDHVATITFTRPDLLNRFDRIQESEIAEVLDSVEADPDVRAVALLALGRAFSAGGDFDLMLSANHDTHYRESVLNGARRLGSALLGLSKPLVVGVHGAAIGLGATVALAGDVVVASSNAFFADTHVAVGLVAGDGGALYWPQSAGMLRARRHLLTGDPVTAEEAHRYGLVTDLVENPDDVGPAVRAIAAQIASLPPLAVQGTKRALNQITKAHAAVVSEAALVAEGATLSSRDLAEAISAFRAKRPGRYEGR